MTLRQKLYFLAGINIFLTLIVGVMGFWGISRLDPSNSPVTTQMKAVRNAMTVDMMHDAFNSDVLRALLVSTTGDTRFGSEAEISDDLARHSEVMNEAIAENKALPLSAHIQEELAKTAGPIASYQSGAKNIVRQTFKDPKSALSIFEDFQGLFRQLEDVLEESSGVIATESQETFAQEVASAEFLKKVIWTGLLIAAIVAIWISTLVVKSVMTPMKRALEELTATSTDLRRQADTLTESSSDLNAASNEQSAAVQESVAAIAEILSMVSQTTNFSEQSISSSSTMTDRTQEGNRIINRLAHSIGSIQQANAQLMEMANIIQEISNKATVINDIVFKTQLLSFNASIEAARAGQHGRGFAVVAEEVGNLAEMSGSSAREIQSLLEDSQKQVSLIVESVQKRVQEGEQVASEAVAIFNKISGETSNLNGFINRIGEATKEQETGIHQISTAMNQVGISAQKNLSSATQASLASRKLSSQSVALAGVVSSLEHLMFGRSAFNDASRDERASTSARERYISLTEEYHPSTNGVSSQHNGMASGKSVLADDESFRPYVG
jgi:methyl-accepting chemotaxis protein